VTPERAILLMLLAAAFVFTLMGLVNGEVRGLLLFWLGIAIGILAGAVAESEHS
jgi:hypothetical protein